MQSTVSNTVITSHDVIGRCLPDLRKGETKAGDVIEMPKIFLQIYEYFTEEHKGIKRMREENLFKIKASMNDVDILEKHVSLGNYKFLQSCDVHVVATLLKTILKCLAEPLCKYSNYD